MTAKEPSELAPLSPAALKRWSCIKQKLDKNRMTTTCILSIVIWSLILSSSIQPSDAHSLGKVKSSRDRGCYYMLQHYKNGEQIKTDEPCLNCTCENSMLMCYLKVCPYVKPVGDRCIIERVQGECCPRITCPDVAPPSDNIEQEVEPETALPVSTTTTTTSTSATPTEAFAEVRFANTSLEPMGQAGGCVLGDKFYKEGDQMPNDASKPCEVCYCIRNSSACVMQECALEVSGCAPIYNAGGCCPTRYNCSADNAFTTPRPGGSSSRRAFWDFFTGGPSRSYEGITSIKSATTSTTTSRPIAFPDFGRSPDPAAPGCKAPNSTRTYADGERVLSKNKCEHCYCMRSEIVCAVQECRPPCDGCVPIIDSTDQCCPKRYECAAPSQRVPPDNVLFEPQDFNVSTANEVVAVQDDRKQTDDQVSAHQQQKPSEITGKVPNELTPKGDRVSELQDSSSSTTSSAAPEAIASDQPSPTTNDAITEMADLSKQEPSVMTTRQTKPPLRPISPKLSSNEDESVNELSPDSGALNTTAAPTNATNANNVDGFNLHGEREQESDSVKSTSRSEVSEGPQGQPDVNEIVSPSLTSTLAPLQPAQDDSGTSTTVMTNEQTNAPLEAQNLVNGGERKSRPLVVPSTIPGEGSCRYNGKIYQNGEEVKYKQNCTELCMCINSVVYCDEVDCPRGPENPDRCQKVMVEGECCPKYICPETDQSTNVPNSTSETNSPEISESGSTESATTFVTPTSTLAPPVIPTTDLTAENDSDLKNATPASTTLPPLEISPVATSSEPSNTETTKADSTVETSSPSSEASSPSTVSVDTDTSTPKSDLASSTVVDSVSTSSPETKLKPEENLIKLEQADPKLDIAPTSTNQLASQATSATASDATVVTTATTTTIPASPELNTSLIDSSNTQNADLPIAGKTSSEATVETASVSSTDAPPTAPAEATTKTDTATTTDTTTAASTPPNVEQGPGDSLRPPSNETSSSGIADASPEEVATSAPVETTPQPSTIILVAETSSTVPPSTQNSDTTNPLYASTTEGVSRQDELATTTSTESSTYLVTDSPSSTSSSATADSTTNTSPEGTDVKSSDTTLAPETGVTDSIDPALSSVSPFESSISPLDGNLIKTDQASPKIDEGPAYTVDQASNQPKSVAVDMTSSIPSDKTTDAYSSRPVDAAETTVTTMSAETTSAVSSSADQEVTATTSTATSSTEAPVSLSTEANINEAPTSPVGITSESVSTVPAETSGTTITIAPPSSAGENIAREEIPKSVTTTAAPIPAETTSENPPTDTSATTKTVSTDSAETSSPTSEVSNQSSVVTSNNESTLSPQTDASSVSQGLAELTTTVAPSNEVPSSGARDYNLAEGTTSAPAEITPQSATPDAESFNTAAPTGPTVSTTTSSDNLAREEVSGLDDAARATSAAATTTEIATTSQPVDISSSTVVVPTSSVEPSTPADGKDSLEFNVPSSNEPSLSPKIDSTVTTTGEPSSEGSSETNPPTPSGTLVKTEQSSPKMDESLASTIDQNAGQTAGAPVTATSMSPDSTSPAFSTIRPADNLEAIRDNFSATADTVTTTTTTTTTPNVTATAEFMTNTPSESSDVSSTPADTGATNSNSVTTSSATTSSPNAKATQEVESTITTIAPASPELNLSPIDSSNDNIVDLPIAGKTSSAATVENASVSSADTTATTQDNLAPQPNDTDLTTVQDAKPTTSIPVDSTSSVAFTTSTDAPPTGPAEATTKTDTSATTDTTTAASTSPNVEQGPGDLLSTLSSSTETPIGSPAGSSPSEVATSAPLETTPQPSTIILVAETSSTVPSSPTSDTTTPPYVSAAEEASEQNEPAITTTTGPSSESASTYSATDSHPTTTLSTADSTANLSPEGADIKSNDTTLAPKTSGMNSVDLVLSGVSPSESSLSPLNGNLIKTDQASPKIDEGPAYTVDRASNLPSNVPVDTTSSIASGVNSDTYATQPVDATTATAETTKVESSSAGQEVSGSTSTAAPSTGAPDSIPVEVNMSEAPSPPIGITSGSASNVPIEASSTTTTITPPVESTTTVAPILAETASENLATDAPSTTITVDTDSAGTSSATPEVSNQSSTIIINNESSPSPQTDASSDSRGVVESTTVAPSTEIPDTGARDFNLSDRTTVAPAESTSQSTIVTAEAEIFNTTAPTAPPVNATSLSDNPAGEVPKLDSVAVTANATGAAATTTEVATTSQPVDISSSTVGASTNSIQTSTPVAGASSQASDVSISSEPSLSPKIVLSNTTTGEPSSEGSSETNPPTPSGTLVKTEQSSPKMDESLASTIDQNAGQAAGVPVTATSTSPDSTSPASSTTRPADNLEAIRDNFSATADTVTTTTITATTPGASAAPESSSSETGGVPSSPTLADNGATTNDLTTTSSTPPPDAATAQGVTLSSTSSEKIDSPTTTESSIGNLTTTSVTASPADEFLATVSTMNSADFKPINLTTTIPSIRGSSASITIPWTDIGSNTTTGLPISIGTPTTTASAPTVISSTESTTESLDLTNDTLASSTPSSPVTTPSSIATSSESDYEEITEEAGCEYEGKTYNSAQQIPRSHPCDFCFCFRGDIICLQQTCPPPVPHCFETVIDGFCCPRYECPVHTVRTSPNSTSLSLTPYETHSRLHSHTHDVDASQPSKASNIKGCFVDNKLYGVGQPIASASGPCLDCRCDKSGMMRCNPKECSPDDPLLQQINREVLQSTLSRSQRRR